MKFLADFHIHSHYSLATSKQLTPQYLDYWAKIKGINVVGTGDFTHPKWTNELKQFIKPAEQGLFKLSDEFILPRNPVKDAKMRFLLTAEISNIYKKNNQVRKIHNVVIAPDFETVEKIQNKLQKHNFNITSDGRPILGLDSVDLFEMLLEINENIIFIPAHIWTPWFAALGSKSGFDTIEECYGELTKYIYAIETGLSSDQPLNWLCSFLDKFSLLSNSDAHSPEKLGRNANVFDTELSYDSIANALKNQQSNEFVGTIDMYPQEGKYHYDGHRKCEICFNPTETMQHKGICPVCGGKLTLGVAHRIAQLADRDNPLERTIKKDFKYIIPLREILAEINGTSSNSKKIDGVYFQIINKLGSETDILLNKNINEIKSIAGELLAIAIERLRNNQVILHEGYDGEYGIIKLFEQNEIKNLGANSFTFTQNENISKKERKLLNFNVAEFRELKNTVKIDYSVKEKKQKSSKNNEQQSAIETKAQNILITAGPGTGKTHVLSERIKFLIEKQNVNPEKILAITFSNQAAQSLKQRIADIAGQQNAKKIYISTFHAFGYDFLIKNSSQIPLIINDEEKHEILKQFGINNNQIDKILNKFSFAKNTLNFNEFEDEELKYFEKYNQFLAENNFIDFDDLIFKTSALLEANNAALPDFEHILIDEFQDINPVQYKLLCQISNKKTNFFAIGDPFQSIYSFRGSDVNLIEKFKTEFNSTTITLSKSYRCTDNILLASAMVVESQTKIKGVQKGVKLTISEQSTDKSEAEFIARSIEEKLGGTRFFSIDSKVANGTEDAEINSLSDFAILVRTKSIIPTLTKALDDHAIPYNTINTEFGFQEAPFAQMTAVLKHFIYPGNKFFYKYFVELTEGNFNFDDSKSLYDNILKLWNNFFEKKYAKKSNKLEKYIKFAKDKELRQFVSEIEQQTGLDELEQKIEAVQIMTIHASKGLEFNCVYIPALEDGILPYTLFKQTTNIEEEKRLLYVAMTRAKKYLSLSFAKTRYINNLQHNFERSRFIDSIKKEILQFKKQNFKPRSNDNQLSLF